MKSLTSSEAKASFESWSEFFCKVLAKELRNLVVKDLFHLSSPYETVFLEGRHTVLLVVVECKEQTFT